MESIQECKSMLNQPIVWLTNFVELCEPIFSAFQYETLVVQWVVLSADENGFPMLRPMAMKGQSLENFQLWPLFQWQRCPLLVPWAEKYAIFPYFFLRTGQNSKQTKQYAPGKLRWQNFPQLLGM